MAPVLGYWNIRGLGEPVCYLLNFLDVDFEDKRYECGKAPNVFESTWRNEDKHNLGLELPNLPYYIDGDVKITQSIVIMRYFARKHDALYFPESGNDLIRSEMMEGHARDIYIGVAFLAYNPQFEQLRDTFGFRFIDQLKVTSKFLGSNDWILGSKISHVDFLLFEALDTIKLIYPNCFDGLENLVKFQDRFKALPGVQKYMSNREERPAFMPIATWGGSLESMKSLDTK